MKHLLLFLTLSTLLTSLNAQNDGALASHFNAGLGFSDWGIPVYASYDINVASDINVGAGLSYRSKSESFVSIGGSRKWRHTIVGVNAIGYYYFNRVLEIPSEFDFYGGASLGFYIWDTSYKGTGAGDITYSGSGNGGLGLGLLAGGRYYFQDNLGVNLEIGGSNVVSGGRIGVTWKL